MFAIYFWDVSFDNLLKILARETKLGFQIMHYVFYAFAGVSGHFKMFCVTSKEFQVSMVYCPGFIGKKTNDT